MFSIEQNAKAQIFGVPRVCAFFCGNLRTLYTGDKNEKRRLLQWKNRAYGRTVSSFFRQRTFFW